MEILCAIVGLASIALVIGILGYLLQLIGSYLHEHWLDQTDVPMPLSIILGVGACCLFLVICIAIWGLIQVGIDAGHYICTLLGVK